MIAAPIPAYDTERLAALHSLGLLDTPQEERFDRITRLLTLVMRVPMAFLSLVDADRQWFKSSCGLSTPETPRAVSFCGHAILSDEAMVVPDATEDERFRGDGNGAPQGPAVHDGHVMRSLGRGEMVDVELNGLHGAPAARRDRAS